MLFGQDNPVDGAVLDVLLRKARDIRRDLGIHVTVPIHSEGVMEAVMRSLFHRSQYEGAQLSLFDTDATDDAAELVSPNDVKRLLQDASQRLPFGLREVGDDRWELDVQGLPPSIRQRLGSVAAPWPITFTSPTPEGFVYVGRNHPLIESLSEHLSELAFHPVNGDSPASRCGVVRTEQVRLRTTLLLLRVRYLQRERPSEPPTLSEETLAWGFEGTPPNEQPLALHTARGLMDRVRAFANLPAGERREVLREVLSWWPDLEPQLRDLMRKPGRDPVRQAPSHPCHSATGGTDHRAELAARPPGGRCPIAHAAGTCVVSAYTCVRTEGGLLSPDILEDIAAREGQKPAAFGLERRRTVVDDATAAWSDVRIYWDGFQRRLARGAGESHVTVTREQWALPLLETLSHKLTYQRSAARVDGRR